MLRAVTSTHAIGIDWRCRSPGSIGERYSSVICTPLVCNVNTDRVAVSVRLVCSSAAPMLGSPANTNEVPSIRTMPAMAVVSPFQNVCQVPGDTVEVCQVLRYGERTISGTAGGRIGVVLRSDRAAAERAPAVVALAVAVRAVARPPRAAAAAPETCRKRRRSILGRSIMRRSSFVFRDRASRPRTPAEVTRPLSLAVVGAHERDSGGADLRPLVVRDHLQIRGAPLDPGQQRLPLPGRIASPPCEGVEGVAHLRAPQRKVLLAGPGRDPRDGPEAAPLRVVAVKGDRLHAARTSCLEAVLQVGEPPGRGLSVYAESLRSDTSQHRLDRVPHLSVVRARVALATPPASGAGAHPRRARRSLRETLCADDVLLVADRHCPRVRGVERQRPGEVGRDPCRAPCVVVLEREVDLVALRLRA